MILSGSNSYSGATTVNTGTLNAANANALGSNNTVTVNDGTLLDNCSYIESLGFCQILLIDYL